MAVPCITDRPVLFMTWMIPSVSASLVGTLVLAVVYLHLYLHYRERFIGIWTIGWAFYAVRFIFQLLILLTHESSFLILGNQLTSLLSGMFLLWGTYAFSGRTLPKWWIPVMVVGFLWILFSVLFDYPFVIVALPTFLFLGAIFIFTGIVFLRFREIQGVEKQVTGWAFITWGIHKINYPFLRPLPAIAPWGYLFAALLEVTVAVGILLSYFQKMRKDLGESEERYSSMFRNSHAVMLLIDPRTAQIVDANPAASSFYGYDRATLTTIKITDLNVLTEDQVFQEMQRAKNEKRNQFYFTHHLANGELRNVEVYSGPVRIKGRSLLYSIIHDITERRQAEENLHNTLSQIAALIENMHEGILFEDRNRRIILVNKSLCSLFDCDESPGDLVGAESHAVTQKASSHFTASDEFLSRMDRISRERELVSDERLFLADGRILERDYVPIFTAGMHIGHLWQYRDITEQRKLQNQLRHAQKMEAIGTLAGGIAHDFNNILTAIIGYGSILKLRMDGSDQLGTYVDQILSSSERAATLTQSLLAFSRRQKVILKPVNIHEIAQRVNKLLQRLIGEDIELNYAATDSSANVLADSGQIEQVLMNLATNARDAMPDGGQLAIEVNRVGLDEQYQKSHGYGKPGEYVLIVVSDTGHGMDTKDRERIFEPFFTTKEIGKGTGLGLSIAYGIVKQHNGYINCYSEPGVGTTFKIYLPVTLTEDEPAVSADAARPAGEQKPSSSPRTMPV